jgi:hypothetical protein
MRLYRIRTRELFSHNKLYCLGSLLVPVIRIGWIVLAFYGCFTELV